MKRTNLGVSTSLLASLAYFTAAFGGYPATLIVCGYILLFEKDGKLRKAAVKALVLMVLFSAALSILSLFGSSAMSVSSMITPINTGFATVYTAAVFVFGFVPKIVLSVLGILTLVKKEKVTEPPIDAEY